MNLEYNQYSDEDLVEMITLGNHDAFALLVKRQVTNSYKVAYRIVRVKEDAEDIVQECFLKLWKSPQGFNRNNNTKFSTWFFNVVKNRAIDFLKKNREELLSEDFDLEDNSQNQLKLIESNNENRIFKEALKDLEYNQKQAIELFLDENKHKKSAEIMGISTKAYQSLLMRSKKALKIFYEKKLNKFYDKK